MCKHSEKSFIYNKIKGKNNRKTQKIQKLSTSNQQYVDIIGFIFICNHGFYILWIKLGIGQYLVKINF